jgi:hypothetical protein
MIVYSAECCNLFELVSQVVQRVVQCRVLDHIIAVQVFDDQLACLYQ